MRRDAARPARPADGLRAIRNLDLGEGVAYIPRLIPPRTTRTESDRCRSVVPQERVLAEATALADRLARGPGAALGVTKRALDVEFSQDLETALQYEAEVQARLMEHPNYREAYEAFRTKREPRFVE